MKATKIKRGRPKKENPSVKDSATPPPSTSNESTAYLNKKYIDKNGHSCTVIYSNCKQKPTEVRYSK
jgi:hypothetical protein